ASRPSFHSMDAPAAFGRGVPQGPPIKATHSGHVLRLSSALKCIEADHAGFQHEVMVRRAEL
ncbi:unnamed protein product, partial [Effrenium voratum]